MKRKYQKIEDEIKDNLLNMVFRQDVTVYRASKLLDIPYNNAKKIAKKHYLTSEGLIM